MAEPEQVRRALRRQPFRPFRLRMVDGREYSVSHPDWVSVPPIDRPREVAYYEMPKDVPADQVESYEVHWLDLALISEVIEPAVSAPPPIVGQAP